MQFGSDTPAVGASRLPLGGGRQFPLSQLFQLLLTVRPVGLCILPEVNPLSDSLKVSGVSGLWNSCGRVVTRNAAGPSNSIAEQQLWQGAAIHCGRRAEWWPKNSSEMADWNGF